MTDLESLESARGRLQDTLFDFVPFELQLAIDAALSPEPLPGNPAAVRAQAQAYTKAAEQCLQVAVDVMQVSATELPAAWRGQVAENASQAVAALSTEIGKIESDLGQAAGALNSWAELLEWAQAKDAEGRTQLKAARKLASGDGENPFSAQHAQAAKQAQAGVDTRIAAFQAIADQSPKTAGLLTELTSQARAHDVTTPDLDALSAVELAATTDPGGTVDGAQILTPTALTRASQRLDAMSAADQAAFEKLLADAKSPQESAYLYKVLAAGYNLQQISAFDAAIHPHGDDPTWLAEHLTPNLSNDDSTNDPLTTTYKGVSGVNGWGYALYSQGGVNDCVAASTVIAQASMDPVLTLSLTTGYGEPKGGTPAPGDDSPAALQQRLQQVYQKEYAVGRSDDSLMEQWFGSSSGIYSDGGQALANNLLSNSTGTSYHYQGLGDTGDRQAAVPKIEAAVDSGKPVPFQVTNGNDGHQMLIIGHNGDQLEVYNPWGFTQWISESQFVNGDLGSLTKDAASGGPMPTADGVDLPQ
ncbi:MAG TPA: hypothetical protein VL551_01765 [Actinospica sp.]|jgi:hypothetical protein|nr:hypothetical protein [Actinospica sp.]